MWSPVLDKRHGNALYNSGLYNLAVGTEVLLTMIADEDVKNLFHNTLAILAKDWDHTKLLKTQLFRGISEHTWENQHPGCCTRHLLVFDKFNIIPRYCFNCYKVLVEPRTVVELFKLMVVFEKLELPIDNTRKCMVEGREGISGAYKGYIYCRGLEEGKEITEMVRKVVSEEISAKIPVNLKRGCSEYAVPYPEYAQIGDGKNLMTFKEEWQEYEDLADKQLVFKLPHEEHETFNKPAYDQDDAGVMLAWLKYAATIGDPSYLKISGRELSPLMNIKPRPPFQPVDNE